jgi:hypothetical protein
VGQLISAAIPIRGTEHDHLFVIVKQWCAGQSIHYHLDQIINVWLGGLWDPAWAVLLSGQSLWSAVHKLNHQTHWLMWIYLNLRAALQNEINDPLFGCSVLRVMKYPIFAHSGSVELDW